MYKPLRLLLVIAFAIATNNVNAQKIMVTWAGTGTGGFSGDGDIGKNAKINGPSDVCIDAQHNIYFADKTNNRVRKVSAVDGVITTVAGGGTSTADGIPATMASFQPRYLCVDAANNILITIPGKVRKLNTSTGMISTVAGTGVAGYSGDGGPAIAAQLNTVSGICIDAAGNIYIVDGAGNMMSGPSNNRIRRIDAVTGIITTIAGTGVSGYSGDGGPAIAAAIAGPIDMAINSLGDLYFADQNGTRIRKITAATGVISHVAGVGSTMIVSGDGGPASAASIGHIHGVCCDGNDDVYITDESCSCRKITVSTGIIKVVAGSLTAEGYNGDEANALTKWFDRPFGLTIDETGSIYVAENYNNRIRKAIQLKHTPSFAYGHGQSVRPCPGYSIAISNQLAVVDTDMSQPLTWTVIVPPVNGTLAGFPATSASAGTSGVAKPLATTYTSASSFTGTDSFLIRVSDGTFADTVKMYARVELPTVGTITGPTSVCAGSTIDLNNTEPGTWSATNASATVVASTGVVTGVTAGADTIIFTLAGACPLTTSVVVTINPLPNPGIITGSDSVCIGSTIALASTMPGGVWNSQNPSIASVVAATGNVGGIAGGPASIKYTVNNGWCSAATTKTVTVKAIATAIGGPGNVCHGTSVTCTEGLPGGVWSTMYSLATVTGTMGTSVFVQGLTPGTDTLIYTNTNSCGTATVKKQIIVRALPSMGVVGGPSNVCTGSSITMGATVSGGTWSATNTHATVNLTSGMVTGMTPGIDTIRYTIGVVYSGGGSVTCSNYADNQVIVGSAASAGVITGPNNVCAAATIAMTPSVPGGTWSTVSGNASISSGGIVTGVTAGAETVVYSLTSSCGVASTTKLITVDGLPDPGITGGVSAVCMGITTALSSTVAGGVWSTPGLHTSVSATSVTGLAAGVETLTYTVTNDCGSSIATKDITVEIMPDPGAIVAPDNICVGATVFFVGVNAGGTWTSDMGNVNVGSLGDVTGAVVGTDVVRYTVVNSCGSAAAIKLINIDSAPDAGTITAATDEVCIGGSITLGNAAAGGVWSVGNSNASITSAGVVTGLLAGSATVKYTVANTCGSAIASKDITVKDCDATGIAPATTANVNIYPNPAGNVLNISCPGVNATDITMVIADATGKVVMRSTLGAGVTTVDISALSEGMYMLRLAGEHVNETKKIVVSRK